MKTKGFTLIELLVVIAIIGILSAVVLTSLGTARNKGVLAKVKSELTSFRSQAELWHIDNGQYNSMCVNDPVIVEIMNDFNDVGDGYCNASGNGDEYRVYVKIPTPSGAVIWCTDHTGFLGEIASPGSLSCN